MFKQTVMQYKKRNKALFALISLALIAFMLTSFTYVVVESEHRCVHQNCEPCKHMEVCLGIIGQFMTFVGILIVSFFLFKASLVNIKVEDLYQESISPVSLKVKLLN